MPSAKFPIAALAGAASARFSGELIVYMNHDGTCHSAETHVHDTVLTQLPCLGNFDCHANDNNQIATVNQVCRTDGLKNDSELHVRPHDTLQFCRKGFCSCMSTHYTYNSDVNGYNAVHFNFDDDNAYACDKW